MPQLNRSLPTNPHISTILYLRRLEAQGYNVVQKLSASHWEAICALEAGGVSSPTINGVAR